MEEETNYYDLNQNPISILLNSVNFRKKRKAPKETEVMDHKMFKSSFFQNDDYELNRLERLEKLNSIIKCKESPFQITRPFTQNFYPSQMMVPQKVDKIILSQENQFSKEEKIAKYVNKINKDKENYTKSKFKVEEGINWEECMETPVVKHN